MYWDSSYTKPLRDYDSNSYVGKYGVITKGSSVTIPIYFNWTYGPEESYLDRTMPEIKIIAKQYTGYNGSIPMNLLGYNLISYKSVFKEIMPVSYLSTCPLNVESINNTSGYLVITNGNYCSCVGCAM